MCSWWSPWPHGPRALGLFKLVLTSDRRWLTWDKVWHGAGNQDPWEVGRGEFLPFWMETCCRGLTSQGRLAKVGLRSSVASRKIPGLSPSAPALQCEGMRVWRQAARKASRLPCLASNWRRMLNFIVHPWTSRAPSISHCICPIVLQFLHLSHLSSSWDGAMASASPSLMWCPKGKVVTLNQSPALAS